jgi:hypothetical protein
MKGWSVWRAEIRAPDGRRPGTGSTHTAQSTTQMLFEIVALIALVGRQRT